jgi:hypothetical protein
MSAEAFRADGTLSGSVAITRGPTPEAEYLEEMIVNLIVHAWDRGTAIGYPGPLPVLAVGSRSPGTKQFASTPAAVGGCGDQLIIPLCHQHEGVDGYSEYSSRESQCCVLWSISPRPEKPHVSASL